MMRSMFSGVSSLKAHQLRMDVIAHNIANVNTVGFKASSVTFAELYSQNLAGASSSTDSRGGTNPMQVGLGANVAAVAVNHNKGSVQRTDVVTDLMVDGNGFFMVSSDGNGENKFYTRAGNFKLDELGFMVTPEGFKVLDTNHKPVQVNQSDTKSASPSKNIVLKGNINTAETKDYVATVDLYDSLGDIHTINVKFSGPRLTTTAPKTMDTNDPRNTGGGGKSNYSYKKITFEDAKGTQLQPTVASGKTWYAKFNAYGEPVDIVELNTPNDPNGAETAVNGTLTLSAGGAHDIAVPINRSMFFNNADIDGGVRTLSEVSNDSDAKGVQLGGISSGTIESFNISSKGEVIAKYTNGEEKVLSIIGLADFDNPSGLMKIGNNLFTTTPNSGVPKFGGPSTGSFGSLTPGALEMSNVDLAAQFTDMITTQRGFQANSRVITTSDEILQELVNLKR